MLSVLELDLSVLSELSILKVCDLCVLVLSKGLIRLNKWRD
ncbi:hypothetical protein [Haloimpatiens massiliensis]|nr:hypothetical protein [Haloimpatiens massiliensis]